MRLTLASRPGPAAASPPNVYGAATTGAPEEVAFGPSMTALNFPLTRALGRMLRDGDEVVVSALDHGANVAAGWSSRTASGSWSASPC